MGIFGQVAMYIGFIALILSAITAVVAELKGDHRLVRFAETMVYVSTGALTLAVGALQLALLSNDFTIQYVQDYSSTTLSPIYRVGAMWAGQGGSLLLWAWLVALLSAWITYFNRVKRWEASAWVTMVFSLIAGLFSALVLFVANPFDAAEKASTEGQGLNPLLQDPLQIIHPLMLYGGYVLYTVPFALIVGGLLKGQVSGPWIKIAQRWNVLAWILLTAGIILGARWAYAELGWGGYWGWDPVENASLLPWLTGTAVMHQGLTHRENHRLKLSSVILVMTTFSLCLFGTFLTRSGVIQSVHAFGESNLGVILGSAITVIVLGLGALVVWRLPDLRFDNPDKRSHGWLGQIILLTLLTAITVAVLWGTLYPLFSRAVRGQEIAVTPGFFRVVVTPLGIAILGLFAISPLLPGQRVLNQTREWVIRVGIFALTFLGIMLVTSWANPGVALVTSLAVLAIITVVRKAIPRVKDSWNEDVSPVWGAIRATGPYVGHVGLILLLAAVTFNSAFQLQGQADFTIGKTAVIGGQTVRLDALRVDQLSDRNSFVAKVSIVDSNGQTTGALESKLEKFANSESPHAAVGIRSGLFQDVYVVVDSADATPGAEKITLTVFTNPAVIWLWIGGFLLTLGGVLYAIPRRRKIVLESDISEEDEQPTEPDESAELSESDAELVALLDAAILRVKSSTETKEN